jgi:Na+-transporting methylmalonyl-CoA/oxaloacetate decarboxylase gamma subunit
MKIYLFALTFFSNSNFAYANRNPYSEGGAGSSFAMVFLFGVIPVLLWLLGKFLNSSEKKEEKKEEKNPKNLKKSSQFDISESAKKNALERERINKIIYLDCYSCGKKIPKVAKFQQHMTCLYCKSSFQNPDWVKPVSLPISEISVIAPKLRDIDKPIVKAPESTQPAKLPNFPSLTAKELEYVNWHITKINSSTCPNCLHKDLIGCFETSSAGNNYLKCNKCNTHFQFAKPEIMFVNYIYARCPDCKEVIHRSDLMASSAGHDLAVCPCCNHNFHAARLSVSWLDDMNDDDSQIYQPSYHAKAKIILNVRSRMAKENQRILLIKKYQRTVANSRFLGFSRKQRRVYVNKRRISIFKRSLSWYISREPVT